MHHPNQKVGKWLSKLSTRVNFYGNIMDVLVQHHPEYVALAWGGMKCLFVVSKPIQVQSGLVKEDLKSFSLFKIMNRQYDALQKLSASLQMLCLEQNLPLCCIPPQR